jgi:hypothetical protein
MAGTATFMRRTNNWFRTVTIASASVAVTVILTLAVTAPASSGFKDQRAPHVNPCSAYRNVTPSSPAAFRLADNVAESNGC